MKLNFSTRETTTAQIVKKVYLPKFNPRAPPHTFPAIDVFLVPPKNNTCKFTYSYVSYRRAFGHKTKY